MSTPRPNRNVHRFAVFTAVYTFFVLIAGALVTSNDAGLSVPDWPLSYGSFLPPMVGGIFYEHGHRMVAALLGVFSIVLATWLWRVESRGWLRWLGVAAVAGVVAQGLLGGITVMFFLPPAVSSAHATLAQIFFATLVSIAFFTSAWWERHSIPVVRPVAGNVANSAIAIHRLAGFTVAAVLMQLMLGAAFRHKAFSIIPHLIGAVVVTAMIFWLAGTLRRRYSGVPALRAASIALHAIIGVQLILGALAWWSRIYGNTFPQPVPVMVTFTVIHTVTGALVLATTVLVTLACYRLVPTARAQGATATSMASRGTQQGMAAKA